MDRRRRTEGKPDIMGLGNAILTGFTGIQTNQAAIETIGNNVANVNTTGFKESRALFETLMFQTVQGGTAPNEIQGGTNPIQFGYGAGLATTQRNFAQGATQRTGVQSDLAVDGRGFFILNSPTGDQVYTRDGAFSLSVDSTLVAANGSLVQGFAASSDGTIDTGTLTDLRIPVGVTSEASATTRATLIGNLDAGAEIASTGAVAISSPQVTADGTPATAATPLTSLVDGEGNALFNNADVLTVTGVQKGGIDVPDAQFVVGTDGSTYGDLAAFLETAFAIDTSESAIGAPGVSVGDGTIAPAGALVVNSNAGDVHAISLDASSIRNSTNGALPFSFTTVPSTGEGLTTTFLVFDSLGTPLELRLRMVLESTSDAGNEWRFNVESLADTNPSAFLSNGTVRFDQNGRFVSATGTGISVARGGTGAVTPLAFFLDLSDLTGLTASDGASTLAMASQDGLPEGTLTAYTIGADGVITGTFDNGQKRAFGQVALATFANEQGLVAQSENTFTIGVNTGSPVIAAPLTGTAGRINSGELELSNVDLARELIGLITASTGFSAASRTIRTADDMLQELMLLVR